MKIRHMIPKVEIRFFGLVRILKRKRYFKDGKIVGKDSLKVIGRNQSIRIEKLTEYQTPIGTFTKADIIQYGPSFQWVENGKTTRERRREKVKIIGYRSNNEKIKIQYETSYKYDFLTDEEVHEEIQQLLRIDHYKNVLMRNAIRILKKPTRR